MKRRNKETIHLSVEVEIEYEHGFRDAAVRYAINGICLYGCTNQPADIIARTTGNRDEIKKPLDTHNEGRTLHCAYELTEAKIGAARYEYVRKLNPRQFSDLVMFCNTRGIAFDTEVDRRRNQA